MAGEHGRKRRRALFLSVLVQGADKGGGFGGGVIWSFAARASREPTPGAPPPSSIAAASARMLASATGLRMYDDLLFFL